MECPRKRTKNSLDEDFIPTQLGDGLCFPEAVRAFPGLLQRLGQSLAQGEEVQRPLDLLLLLLREGAQLRQDERGEWIVSLAALIFGGED